MRRRKRSAQRLRREQISIKSEVDYIIRRAVDRDARVMTLGTLVLVSTEIRDELEAAVIAGLLGPAGGPEEIIDERNVQ